MHRTIGRIGALIIGLSLLAANSSFAQTYPNKSIRIIMPIAAGSISDTLLRAINLNVSQDLGQQVIIENRPGGNMVVGLSSCARAEPDGYTLCAVSGNAMSYNPVILETVPYDPDKDFKPITQFYFLVSGILTSNPALKSVADLKAKATSKPGALSVGTFGTGDSTDIFRQLLNKEWNADIAAITYKGGNDLLIALERNDIDMTSFGLGNAIGQIQAGKVNVLFTHSNKRAKLLPNVPTQAEVGLGNLPGMSPWWGLVAPAGVPDEIIAKVNAAYKKALTDPKIVELLDQRIVEGVASSPTEFGSFMKKDREKVAELVKMFNIPKIK